MPYTVIYHPGALEDISRLPQNIKARIRRAIEQRLMFDPLSFGDPLRRSL